MRQAFASRHRSKPGDQGNTRGAPARLTAARGTSNHRFLQRKCACGGAAQSAGECSECKAKRDGARLQHKALASEMARAQGPPAPAAAAAPAPTAPLTVAAAQGIMDRADDLRIDYLNEARRRMGKVQIACRGQADAKQMVDFFPEEMRAFVASFGIGPWSENFCREAALIYSDIEKNLYMSVPPFYFPGLTEPLEPNEMCFRIPGNWMWAHYEDYQIRICPTVLSSDKRDSSRALTLTHEIFHEPSFVMGHETPEVNDTQHCGAVGGDSDEMLNNPYCVTKFIGMVGGHLSY